MIGVIKIKTKFEATPSTTHSSRMELGLLEVLIPRAPYKQVHN